MLLAVVGMAGLVSAQVIDTSETRVQTTLDPGLKRIGTIRPRSVGEIAGQNWSLGCETLDRGFANYDSYKDYLVPLGIKKHPPAGRLGHDGARAGQIRLGAGWTASLTTPAAAGWKYSWRPTTATRFIPAAAAAVCPAGFRRPTRRWPRGTSGSRPWPRATRARCATGKCGTSLTTTRRTRPR